MADTIRIKRRTTGAAGPPATLASAEFAYNAIGDVLYIGKGDNGSGQATSVVAVGGAGAFATDSDLAGLAPLASPAFTGNPTAPTATAGDADTSIATTAFVAAAVAAAGGGGPYQPLDADLTSLAGATGIGVIYYRSAASTWSTVTVGANLTFTGGTLNAVVGEAGTSGIPYVRQSGGWAQAQLIFEALSNKGVANGYAALDASAKVPAAQLPSYVDDVLEYANLAAFPATGTTGVIYVALDTGKIYRWSGSAYVEISPSPGSTDAVPEGSVNLYYTEARVSANATVTSKAPLASPTFTGDPKAPTPATADNDTSIATTQFVKAQGYLVTSDLASYAPLASPTFTGDPKAPTPTAGDNDTSIATTAFVVTALGPYLLSATAASTYAPLASPALTGTPTAPTASAATSTTQIATTAHVHAAIAADLAALSMFRATLSADQTGIAQNTFTKVAFNTAAVNVGSNFSTSTNRWTPPAGHVLLGATLYVGCGASANAYACIYKNGAQLGLAFVNSGANTITYTSVSILDVANGTDFYECFTLQNGPAGATVYSGTQSWFQGARI